jgi:hypothetical protein
MRRLQFAALAAAVGLAPALAFANAVPVTKTAKSGQPIGLIYIFNCQTHLLPGSAYGSAVHGKVTVSKATRDACFTKGEPVLSFTYTSDPGYKGDDTASLYIGGEIQNYRVVVQ